MPSFTAPPHYPVLFQTRLNAFRALLELTALQHQAVLSDDHDELLRLLAQRKPVIDFLSEVQRDQPRLVERWKEDRDHLSPDVSQQCDMLLEELERIARQVTELDQQSLKTLEHVRNLTRRDLKTVAHAAQAHSAYHDTHSTDDPRLLDLNR